MKDYLEYMGIENVIGSKGAIREAFKNGMLCYGQIWMDMIKDRDSAAYSYDEKTKDAIIANILKS
jgi:nucleotidyltransferase substrate binding protein (TIGR01987 family)